MAIRNSLELAEEVRRLRTRPGRALSLRALGKAADLPAPTIARIEEGGGTGYETVVRLAKGLGVSVAELIGEVTSEDSDFVAEMRALDARLDDRGRETVIAAARSQIEFSQPQYGRDDALLRPAAEEQARADIARSSPPASTEEQPRRVTRGARRAQTS